MATLSTVQAINRTALESVPPEAIDITQNLGKLRFLYDSYVVGAGDNFGVNGLIRLFTIPKGARLIDFEVSVEDCGTTGAFTVGWAASPELDNDGIVVEGSDNAGILGSIDCHTAAVSRSRMVSTVAGYMKKFLAEVEVQAKFSAATTAAAGNTFEFAAIIVVD
jgi:hypothetical protein